MRSFSRLKQIDTVICSQGPVVVLTGTIQSRKWLFMKQAAHIVAACHLFQNTHHNLVMVCRNIYRCVDWRQLMLCRSNLIVLGLCRNSQFPAFLIYFFHIRRNSLADSSQIMIIHFLPFRRHRTKKGTTGVHQILSLLKFIFIDQKIFLLRAHRRSDTL